MSLASAVGTSSPPAAEATIPLGRAGTVTDASGAVYLLCVPESDYLSDEVLVCGGGWSM